MARIWLPARWSMFLPLKVLKVLFWLSHAALARQSAFGYRYIQVTITMALRHG
jgi:hypothetical protein